MKRLFVSIILSLISTAILAGEEWHGEFSPPNKSTTNTRGFKPDVIIAVIANIDSSTDGSLTGTITLTGHQVRCHGETKIESGKVTKTTVQIYSEPLPTHNCGRFIFKGEVVDGSWVGTVPWNGISNELTLKKK